MKMPWLPNDKAKASQSTTLHDPYQRRPMVNFDLIERGGARNVEVFGGGSSTGDLILPSLIDKKGKKIREKAPSFTSLASCSSRVSPSSTEKTLEWNIAELRTGVPRGPIRRMIYNHRHSSSNSNESSSRRRKNRCRVLLRNIVGRSRSGELTAIIGPSGAGKTTLLDCLSLRTRNFKGAVHLDGKPPGSDYFATAALVHQDELMFGFLTVREHLIYHAEARMGGDFSIDSKARRRVEEVIAQTGLNKVAETVIGGDHPLYTAKGISGGEKRRLAIATELLTCPSIIFLDEPTSGLDSVIADSVIASLHDLALRGVMVMATVHSPSSDAAQHFTNLMLLTPDGRQAYYGPMARAIHYFASLGHPLPPACNPCDFYLELVSKPSMLKRPTTSRDMLLARPSTTFSMIMNRPTATPPTTTTATIASYTTVLLEKEKEREGEADKGEGERSLTSVGRSYKQQQQQQHPSPTHSSTNSSGSSSSSSCSSSSLEVVVDEERREEEEETGGIGEEGGAADEEEEGEGKEVEGGEQGEGGHVDYEVKEEREPTDRRGYLSSEAAAAGGGEGGAGGGGSIGGKASTSKIKTLLPSSPTNSNHSSAATTLSSSTMNQQDTPSIGGGRGGAISIPILEPPSFFIEPTKGHDFPAHLDHLVGSYERSDLMISPRILPDTAYERSDLMISPRILPDTAHMAFRGVERKGAGYLALLRLNLWRGALQCKRDFVGCYGIFVVLLGAVGLLIGTIYSGQATKQWRDLVGMLFSACVSVLFNAAIAHMVRFPLEGGVILREYMAGANAIGPYVFARFIADLPYVVAPLLFSVAIYWTAGLLASWSAFWQFALVITLISQASISLGVALACWSGDPSIGLTLLPILTAPMVMFSGVLYQRSSVPPHLAWMSEFSIVNHGFALLLGLEVPALPGNQAKQALAFVEVDVSPEATQGHYIRLAGILLAAYVITYLGLKMRTRVLATTSI